MEIKSFCDEQLQDVASLYAVVFGEEPWNEPWELNVAIEHLKHIMDGSYTLGFTAWDGGAIAGGLLGRYDYGLNGKAFIIRELFVRHQRRGTGSYLLRYAETYLADNGICHVRLATGRGTPAEQFYRKHGYESHDRVLHLGKRLKS